MHSRAIPLKGILKKKKQVAFIRNALTCTLSKGKSIKTALAAKQRKTLAAQS